MKTQSTEDVISSGIVGGCLKIVLLILGAMILVFFISMI
jgi:hypothetical protein